MALLLTDIKLNLTYFPHCPHFPRRDVALQRLTPERPNNSTQKRSIFTQNRSNNSAQKRSIFHPAHQPFILDPRRCSATSLRVLLITNEYNLGMNNP